jgi:hypothetical protein
MMKAVDWRELYQAAMLELDPDELQKKVSLAGHGMRDRLAEMSQNSRDARWIEEQRAISDAKLNLATLERWELTPRKANTATGPMIQPTGAL